MVVLGIWSYLHLPRLEDPEFTIKDALIITPYPGASAQEVEKEVSDVIELATQQLEQLDRVVSRSERGRSTVTVTIKDQYDRHSLPQVWDELRRKVADAQRRLPPGAGPSLVLDDFGDVFGIFFALTGPDFSDAQLYDTAKLLRRELLLVPDVKKIEIFGHQQEVIYIELARDRMAQLGIRPDTIFAALREQNLVVPSGAVDVGPIAITIDPTGEWTGVEDFENLLIRGEGDRGNLVYLRDIATVRRDYIDPPTTSLRYDGERAIGIGISTVGGGNVVTMGAAVERRIRELGSQIPLGMELHNVSFQADTVTEAIDEFILNLGMAVVIVFIVLLCDGTAQRTHHRGDPVDHHVRHDDRHGADRGDPRAHLPRRPHHCPRDASGQCHRHHGRDARRDATGPRQNAGGEGCRYRRRHRRCWVRPRSRCSLSGRSAFRTTAPGILPFPVLSFS